MEDLGEQVVRTDVVRPPQRGRGHTRAGQSDGVLRRRGRRLEVFDRDVVAQHVQDRGDVALDAGVQHLGQFGVGQVRDGAFDRGVHAVVEFGVSRLETFGDADHEGPDLRGLRGVVRDQTSFQACCHGRSTLLSRSLRNAERAAL